MKATPLLRVLVCGGRDFTDYKAVKAALDAIAREHPDKRLLIIHGAARGADRLGAFYAEQRGLPALSMPAEWSKFDKAAGAVRNRQMLDVGQPNLVVAFPGGRGTADMIRAARQANVLVHEVGREDSEVDDLI